MSSIGGYLGWEFPKGQEYHDQLLRLNTGRNAFEYILRTRKYKKVYFPYYCCDVLLEPIKKTGIEQVFYHTNDKLEPVIDFPVKEDECLLYVNYFGVKNDTAAKLAKQIPSLVVDNSQSFFTRPDLNIDTFYSCRKFFGVPDGAYLNIGNATARFPADVSYDHCTHLLQCVDTGIESGFPAFKANETRLVGQDIRQMSALTRKMMEAAPYSSSRHQRNENFLYLHSRLADINELKLNFSSVDGPLNYPLLISNPDLRRLLIGEKIFIGDFWPGVRTWASKDSYEYFLSENLLALPIDQRYNEKDMARIIENILKFI